MGESEASIDDLGRKENEAVAAYIKVLSQYLPGSTKEPGRCSEQGKPVFNPTFETKQGC
jgi:hypothetical protein